MVCAWCSGRQRSATDDTRRTNESNHVASACIYGHLCASHQQFDLRETGARGRSYVLSVCLVFCRHAGAACPENGKGNCWRRHACLPNTFRDLTEEDKWILPGDEANFTVFADTKDTMTIKQ